MSNLNIKAFAQMAYSTGTPLYVVTFMAAEYYSQPSTQTIVEIGTPANPTATPWPIYPDMASAISGLTAQEVPNVIAACNTLAGSTVYTSGTVSLIDPAVGAALASLANVARTGDYNDLINKPTSGATFTQSSETRTLNTAFQISTTNGAFVSYSVRIANTLTLTGGAAGDVILEIATNSGFTTGVQELARGGNSNTGGLVVGLTLNDSIGVTVNGFVPANYYARLRTVNVTGTPTYTYLAGQKNLVS